MEKKQDKKTGAALAIVRVRGDVHRTQVVRSTFQMLRLGKKNVCAVWPDTPAIRGMIRKIKDYVTWGTMSDETYAQLKQKRISAYENVFFLAPPRKGYGRKGIKKSFTIGGALGERHEKINDLIQRMI